MFKYYGKIKSWLVYSCPWRVIFLFPTDSRKQTMAILFTMRVDSRLGKNTINKTTYIIPGNVIKSKKPTLRYIIPVLGRIIDRRYYNKVEDLSAKFEHRTGPHGIIGAEEDEILREVGFYE
jgi:hypothetical protein